MAFGHECSSSVHREETRIFSGALSSVVADRGRRGHRSATYPPSVIVIGALIDGRGRCGTDGLLQKTVH